MLRVRKEVQKLLLKFFSPTAISFVNVSRSVGLGKLGSLSTRFFEARTTTGREHFANQDSGVFQTFIVIISNGEKILINVNVVV